MEYLTLLLSTLIGKIGCDSCLKYYNGNSYYTYCSGYCTGYFRNQYCSYSYYHYNTSLYYDLSGGAIAGLVIGLIFTAGIFVAIVVCCVKAHNRKMTGRVLTTGPNTTVAVTTTIRAGYTQPPPVGIGYPTAPPSSTSYPAAPPPYGNFYSPPQPMAAYSPQSYIQQPFPAQQSVPTAPHYGYNAPTQPQYSTAYNNPAFNTMPSAQM